MMSRNSLSVFHKTFYNKVLRSYQRAWLEAMLDGDTFILGSRRIGKSFLTAYCSLLLANGYKDQNRTIEAADVIIISKDLRTAAEMIREVEKHAGTMDIFKKITHDTRGSTTSIWLKNGRKIMALPGLPKSARGLSGNVIVDEFAYNDDSHEELFAMATTIPSSHKNLRTIILTNADHQGSWTDNFLHSDETTWEKRRRGFRLMKTNIDDVFPKEYPEHIQLQKDRLLPRIWSREYLCEFLTGEDTLFDAAGLEAETHIALKDYSVVLAYDPGFAKDPAGYCIMKMSNTAIEVLEADIQWELSEQDQRNLIKGLVKEYDIAKILIDPGTAGFTLAANLQREFGGMVEKLSVNSNRYASWVRELQRLVLDRQISFNFHNREMLIDQLSKLGVDHKGKVIVPRTKVKGGKVTHQDAAVALLMAMSLMGKVGGRRPIQPFYQYKQKGSFAGF